MPVPITTAVPPELPALLVKDGVAIGGLSAAQRQLALAFVWAGLPEGVLSEREVNEQLRAQLAGAARWLDTDHVELRRWLVDAGWLVRDGFGREYRRVEASALLPSLHSIGAQLNGLDCARFAADCRAEHQARRDARRLAFEARNTTDRSAPVQRAS